MADYRIRITRITNTNRDDDQVLYGGIAQGAGNAVLVLLSVAEEIMGDDEQARTVIARLYRATLDKQPPTTTEK